MPISSPFDVKELQYHIELWSKDGNTLQQCVGASARVRLARAMFPVAVKDYPQNRILIRQGAWVLADSGRPAT